MLKNLMNPTSKIPHLQIVKPSVQRTHRRTRNANKRAGSGGKKPKFRSEGGEEGIRVGEVGVRYERAVEISRFRRRPCSEIYIFGAKGEKEGRKKKREEGGKVNESFLLTPARRGQNPPRTRHLPSSAPQASMGGDFSAPGPNHASAMPCVLCCPCSRSDLARGTSSAPY